MRGKTNLNANEEKPENNVGRFSLTGKNGGGKKLEEQKEEKKFPKGIPGDFLKRMIALPALPILT